MPFPDLLTPVDREPVGGIPWMTWAPHWRPVLRAFAEAKLPPVRVLERDEDNLENWSLPTAPVPDELWDLAESFLDVDLAAASDNAVLLTGMLDEIGDRTAELFGWLRETLVALHGGRQRAAIAAPVGSVSNSGWMHLHCDILGPDLMFNVFQEVPARWRRKRGATYLLKVDAMLDALAEAGLTAWGRRVLAQIIERSAEDEFAAVTGDTYGLLLDFLLYGDDPDATEKLYRDGAPAVDELLFDRAARLQLERGEGYFVHDRKWLHGRGPITWRGIREPDKRLFRLTYDPRGD